MGVSYSKGVMKNIVPIVMAGVLGIYGLIVAVIITQAITPPTANAYTQYSIYNGWAHVSSLGHDHMDPKLIPSFARRYLKT
jgi:V-type H+-transporting ATPase proteolipid subunit